jgi:hypothetical protein
MENLEIKQLKEILVTSEEHLMALNDDDADNLNLYGIYACIVVYNREELIRITKERIKKVKHLLSMYKEYGTECDV